MLAGHISTTTIWRVQAGGIPHHDHACGAIARKSVGQENDAQDRDQREQAPVWPFADPGDQRRAPVAHRHKNVRPEKNNKTEDFTVSPIMEQSFRVERLEAPHAPRATAAIMASGLPLSMTPHRGHEA